MSELLSQYENTSLVAQCDIIIKLYTPLIRQRELAAAFYPRAWRSNQVNFKAVISYVIVYIIFNCFDFVIIAASHSSNLLSIQLLRPYDALPIGVMFNTFLPKRL